MYQNVISVVVIIGAWKFPDQFSPPPPFKNRTKKNEIKSVERPKQPQEQCHRRLDNLKNHCFSFPSCLDIRNIPSFYFSKGVIFIFPGEEGKARPCVDGPLETQRLQLVGNLGIISWILPPEAESLCGSSHRWPWSLCWGTLVPRSSAHAPYHPTLCRRRLLLPYMHLY